MKEIYCLSKSARFLCASPCVNFETREEKGLISISCSKRWGSIPENCNWMLPSSPECPMYNVSRENGGCVVHEYEDGNFVKEQNVSALEASFLDPRFKREDLKPETKEALEKFKLKSE